MVTNDKAILSKFDNAKTPIDISRVYVKQEIKWSQIRKVTSCHQNSISRLSFGKGIFGKFKELIPKY